MVSCPECDSNLDVDADEIDEGEVVSCVECAPTLKWSPPVPLS